MQESRTITRRSASNLALAFILLPRSKRDGMSALYAFCREVDDVADDEATPVQVRRKRLEQWREDVRRACEGQTPAMPVNRELQAVIQRHNLRLGLFEDLLRGVEMDLDIKRYDTHQDLELYCYRVASVVGLLSIEIFGYRDPRCRDYAIHLGKALQLTNILRDVAGDAQRGRIYLPLAELARWNVTPEEVLQQVYSSRFEQLARSVAERACRFYAMARESLPAVDRRSMIAAELMALVYWRLLRKLERRRFNVFEGKPMRLHRAHKAMLVGKTWLRLALGASSPGYGR
jgi:phytoene synthase